MNNSEPDNPTRTLSSPTPPSERNPVIDILRGFALFGILLVNFPGSEAARAGGVDDAVGKLLSLFVSGKFYTTFSFLFGLGFALQLIRAQSRGQLIVPVYIKRMLVLFLIGLAHAILIWEGDVLMVYAVMGLFLVPFRNRSARVLLPAVALVLAAQFFLSFSDHPYFVRDLVPRVVNPEVEQESELQKAIASNEIRDAWRRVWAADKSGTYLEAVAARFNAWKLSSRFMFRYIWLTSFAMFLLGMLAGRYRLIRYPLARSDLIKRVIWIACPIWLVLGIFTTYGTQVLGPLYYRFHWRFTFLAWILQGPAGSLFYISTILFILTRLPGWIARLAPLAAVGRMALTNYLLQSIVGTILYYNYGLNLQTKLGYFPGLLLAMIVFALQILLSTWWLKRFRFGPMEWLWRSLTYGRFQPFLIPSLKPAEA
ncbi:MAG TPA: DUF418 domain-containing protein [Terriglobia bacterium]|nr:DUF418 domain-containing protein [Terriglobia bacterium]